MTKQWRPVVVIVVVVGALTAGCLERAEEPPTERVDAGARPPAQEEPSTRYDVTGTLLMTIRPTGPNATINASITAGGAARDAAFLATYDGPPGSGLAGFSGDFTGVRVDNPRAGLSGIEIAPVAGPAVEGRLWMRFGELAFGETFLVMFSAADAEGPLPFSLWINGTDLETLSVSFGSALLLHDDAWRQEDVRLEANPGRGPVGLEATRARSATWTTTNGTVFVSMSESASVEYGERELRNRETSWRTHALDSPVVEVQPDSELPATILLVDGANEWTYDITTKLSTARPTGLHLVADVPVPDAWIANGAYFGPFR